MRRIDRRAAPALDPAYLPRHHPVLRRVLAARAVGGDGDLDHSLGRLAPPDGLLDLERAAALLDDAIESSSRIVVAGDYDADGATGCALAVRGLRLLGAPDVRYVVPDRRRHGYGLTPELVDIAHTLGPRLIVTVDNGISSVEGVARAKALGIRVLITDHHLPGAQLPAADAIVNPHRPDDGFPSKCLAGVGVMFYILGALRARRRARSAGGEAPNLAALLDLVALGTVADVVPLDYNNRILVEQGLRRIRAGRASPGVTALLRVAGRDVRHAVAADLGFAAGPRLNAAGRLTDMRRGIECLLCDRADHAMDIAGELDTLNAERREIEAGMQAQATALLDAIDDAAPGAAVALYREDWHPGVVGILASRVKDRLHRPVAAFAPDMDGEHLKGSVRSIPGVHVRDLLDTLATRHPGIVERFGGHAMAAGLVIRRRSFDRFREAFAAEADRVMTQEMRHAVVLTDGEIPGSDFDLDLARAIRDATPWGQAFPEPVFDGVFRVERERLVGDRHTKLRLRPRGVDRVLDAIAFNREPPLVTNSDGEVRMAYRFVVNVFRGEERPELVVEEVEAAP
ncbi:MAG: single-stranded-DNA-specific exonuclease RecJ [Thiotrichales bacterium]|nr:single-stranded-DNA-specific exonuclease RecJ [Thiotrichales bacterium]